MFRKTPNKRSLLTPRPENDSTLPPTQAPDGPRRPTPGPPGWVRGLVVGIIFLLVLVIGNWILNAALGNPPPAATDTPQPPAAVTPYARLSPAPLGVIGQMRDDCPETAAGVGPAGRGALAPVRALSYHRFQLKSNLPWPWIFTGCPCSQAVPSTSNSCS
jgi:hypothetical protein